MNRIELMGKTKVCLSIAQNGHEKQDCERVAAKPWNEQEGSRDAAFKATTLGDDLFCNPPLWESVLTIQFICYMIQTSQ
jgi:hypothetical protein